MAKEPSTGIILSEEEIFDVSLSTFYVFDKENAAAPRNLRGGPCVNPPAPARHLRGGPCNGSSIG
jgi:hypothetical protein